MRPPDGRSGDVLAGDVLVSCHGLSRTFGTGPGSVVAVHGVTCEVRAGERIAVTGPSGSGKSTLLHLLAGLDRPTAGSVTWPGLGGADRLRPGPVGVVFQGQSLIESLDVAENVALPLLLAGAGEAEAADMAGRAHGLLGLAELAERLPEELSGGQAQRVAVARVLAGRPRLILADEPTGQLDHVTGAGVIDALVQTAAGLGAALVLTTHDDAVADRLALHWRMADGTLTGAGDRGLSCSA